MSLSKVYRDIDTTTLRPFRYLEFGPDGTPREPAEVEADIRFTPQTAETEGARAAEETPTAREQLERQLEEAYSRGRQDGLAEGKAALNQTADALAGALEEISLLRESLLKNSSQDMLNLVLVIARQVLQTELALNAEVILETIEKALKVAVRADNYHILVNAADLAIVEEKKPLFMARIAGLKNITFAADPEIGRGGCRVESEFGEVDATIESQFEVIRNTLIGAAGEEG